MTKKLYNYVCDNPACCKCINKESIIFVKGKKRILHYCSEECKNEHRYLKPILNKLS
jgi:hypothetical protein